MQLDSTSEGWIAISSIRSMYMPFTSNSTVLSSKKVYKLFLLALSGIILIYPTAGFCGRDVLTFPFHEDFDANDYQDIVWTTGGAQHEWVSNGGWQGGGAAKFYPPTQNDQYCALGQFTELNNHNGSEQVNVRFLIYHGPEFHNIVGYKKLLVLNREGVHERPMLGGKDYNGQFRSYAPCDNTLCRYYSHDDNPDLGWWPGPNEPLKIAPGPGNRAEEWISVEFEANMMTGMIKVYVDTQDGELSGLYRELPFLDAPVGGIPFSHIDVIGGYFNTGNPHDPEKYYIIDELAINNSYIGPPEGFVEGADPSPSSENSYIMLNPRMTSASVMSLSDNNWIIAGDTTLNLDLYERGSLTPSTGVVLTPGMVISGTGPFDLGSLTSATDTPAHVSMLGTEFVLPHIRNSYRHMYYMVSPNGAANVEINIAGDVYQHSLPQGEMVTFDAGERNAISAVITSDNPILVSHRADLEGNQFADANPVPPAAQELWGIHSGAYIGAVEDNTHISIYASNGTSRNLILNAGAIANVAPTGASTGQGRGDAIHIVANKSIGAVQFADGDGGDQTAFYPTSLLHKRFGLPKDSQYIAIACPESGTNVTLYRPNMQPETLSCNANGNFPGKAYFGRSDANVVTIPQGSYLESNEAIHVIYEVSGSEDEHNLVGTSDQL